MRICFLSEICRQSRSLIFAKKWRVWEEFLNWHFLENKNAHDLRNNTVDLGISWTTSGQNLKGNSGIKIDFFMEKAYYFPFEFF